MAAHPNTREYYADVAHKFEELSDHVRHHPDADLGMSDRLKALAGEILKDIKQAR